MDKNEETVDKLMICNEILLLQIRIQQAHGEQSGPTTIKKSYTIISKTVGFFLILFLLTCNSLIALPVLVQSIVNANSNGATVGSFDGGTNQLTTVANLSVSGQTRKYVAQYFVPTVTGSYDIGLSSSSEDTVLVLYQGSFDPGNPGINSLTLIDDYSGSRPPGVSVSSGSCGATDPDGSYCPQISANLVGGQTYFIVVTSYSPNMTVSDGVNMYVYGSPVFIGTATQDGATASVKRLLRLNLSDVMKNLGHVNEKFMDGATKRHFSDVSRFWEEGDANSQQISDDENSNDNLKLTDDIVEIHWSEKQITKISDKKRLIFETYVEHQKRPGIKEQTDLNLKFAKENFNKGDRTNGISLELQTNFQKLSNFSDAEFRHINLLLGGYSIRSLGKSLLLQGHASVGIGKGKQLLNTGSQTWNTDFDTKTLLIGGSLTGKIKVNPYAASLLKKKFEIWPTLFVEHGQIHALNVHSRLKYGAIDEELDVSGLQAGVTSLTFSPKFLFTNGLHQSDPTFVFAPQFSCLRVAVNATKETCGFGANFGIFQQSNGQKLFDLSIKKIGPHQSILALLELNFQL
ncbi:hypothetical protein OAM32_03915 [Alphaproteobacteria bacterium]|nr:hypothetical protein [Alphaproteobacteria bacterium]